MVRLLTWLVAQLEKEYQMEVENSRKLQSLSSSRLGASQGPSSSSAAAVAATSTRSPEEIEKDDASLRIYEDLTELQIVNVKVKHGKAGKEVTLNCLHTNKAAARSESISSRGRREVWPRTLGSQLAQDCRNDSCAFFLVRDANRPQLSSSSSEHTTSGPTIPPDLGHRKSLISPRI
jgi:hypothetical protein